MYWHWYGFLLSLRHTQCYGRQGNSVTATDTCLTQDQGRLPLYPSVTPVYPVYPSENLLSTEGGQNVLHPLQSVESNVTNGRTDKIARHSLATPMADGWMLKNNHAQAITSQLSTTHSENHQHLVTTEYGAIGKMSSPAKLAGPNETAPIHSPMDSTGCPTTSSIEYAASVNPTDQSNHCTGQLVQQNSSTLYGHILGTRFHGIPVSFSPVYATAGSTISITTDSICSMNRLPSTGSYRPPAHPDYPVTILSSALPSNAQADKCVSAGFRSPSVNSAAVEPDFNCIVSQNDMGTVDFLQSENALSTGELGLEIMDVFSLARLDGQTRNPLHDLADSLWDSCNNKDQGQRNSFTRVDSPTKCASTQETFHSEKLQKNIQAIEILFLDDTGKSLRCFSADGELEIIEGPSDLLGAPDNRTASTASPQERSSVVSKPRYSWDQSGSRPDDTKAKMVEFSITVDHIETEPDASKETQKSPARKMFSIQADNKSAFNSMHITECNKEMYFILSGNTRHVVFRVPDTIFKCLHQEEVEKYCQVRIQVDVPKMSSDNNVAAVMKDRMSIVINPIFTKTMVKTEGQKSQLLQDSSVFCGSSTERDIFCPTITESTKASMNPDSLRRSQRSAPGRTLLCEQPRKRKRTSYHRKVSPKPARATHNSHHSSESAYEKDDFKNVFCKADHDRRIHKLREKIWHQEADLENLRNAKKDQQKISNGTNLWSSWSTTCSISALVTATQGPVHKHSKIIINVATNSANVFLANLLKLISYIKLDFAWKPAPGHDCLLMFTLIILWIILCFCTLYF